VQVAGAASLGEGRLGALRVEIFDRCCDGTALDDRSSSTRLARLLGQEPIPDPTAGPTSDPTLERFLESAAVHGWQRVSADLVPAERAALLADVASRWAVSGADHVVFGDAEADTAPEVETTLSGVTVLVLGR
jgi:hypothetical protein